MDINIGKGTTLAIVTALVCASVLTFAQAYAQEKTAAPQDGRFEFMIGDWNCTGTFFASGTTPAHATTGRAHGEKALGDQWVVVHYDEEKTAANPNPFHVHQYFRHDSAGKQFLTVGVDSAEDSGFTGTSSGWNGDAITFDESSGGKPSNFRDTFGKGTDAMTHSGAARDKNNKWVKTDEETCHRAH